MTDTTREQQLSALSAENEFLKAENERLRQHNELLRKAVFGPKSEKKAISDTAMNSGEQICLFNEAEIESRHEEDDPVTVPAHKRKKKRSRAEIIGELPVEEVVHKVEDKTCDLCGSEMKPVGKEFVHDELVYVPAKLFVRKHYVEVVKCVNCGTDESRDAEQPDDIEKEHFRKAAASVLLSCLRISYMKNTAMRCRCTARSRISGHAEWSFPEQPWQTGSSVSRRRRQSRCSMR